MLPISNADLEDGIVRG